MEGALQQACLSGAGVREAQDLPEAQRCQDEAAAEGLAARGAELADDERGCGGEREGRSGERREVRGVGSPAQHINKLL